MRAAVRSRLLRFVSLGGGLVVAGTLWAQSEPGVPNAPEALRAPEGQHLMLHLQGKGTQIYVCQNAAGVYTWKLKAPDAKLIDENGNPAGRHFAGPTWEAQDGSRVVGKLVKSMASPDSASIPWLLLTAASHEGTGIMTKVQSIQRLDTKGGVAPTAACAAGNENAETPVPYEAGYYFYTGPEPR